MSFIVQPVEAPSIFKIQETISAGAGGATNFYIANYDVLFYNGIASASTVLNITSATGSTLNAAMSDGDVLSVEYRTINGATGFGISEIKIDDSSVGITLSLNSASTFSSGVAGSVNNFQFEITKQGSGQFYIQETTVLYGTGIAAPTAPIMGSAVDNGSADVLVYFSAASGTNIQYYQAVSNPSGIIGQNSASPVRVAGLTLDSSYTFTVAAKNIVGLGPYSSASNSVIPLARGQQEFISSGTFSWIAPAGVTSVSVVAVGGGGGGGKDNQQAGGGGQSYFNSTATVRGNGGGGGRISPGAGGTFVGDGGGNGGAGGSPGPGSSPSGGGGGAGGYSGTGGVGNGSAGTGGAGAGGVRGGSGQGGGGVGLLGEGTSGASNGAGGSGGGAGVGKNGGNYGGGGGAADNEGGGGGGGGLGYKNNFTVVPGQSYTVVVGSGAASIASGTGAGGAVRIIWPGTTRSFPSTNTGNL